MTSKKKSGKKFKQKSQSKGKRKRFNGDRSGNASVRSAVKGKVVHRRVSRSPPSWLEGPEVHESGQASTKASRDGHPRAWHDPFDSYLYPPTSLNFRPPFDTDGSHLSQRSPGLTEYEGKVVNLQGPNMAPGHDQHPQHQHRNHQPPQSRPQSSQTPNQPRAAVNGTTANGETQQRHQNVRDRDTERDQQQRRSQGAPPANGPLASHIQVAKPYVFQQAIEACLKDVGVSQAREDNIRLAGVQWIDNVRRALKLPVRTFDTAVVYYHKFRLVHSDGEYSFVDAAAGALFAACKIEDTLKKSRDILCAAHNLKVPRGEHLSPDDALFEHHSRTIIGLERLMLESSSFDFRNRHPQTLMLKLAKHYELGHPKTSPLLKTAYSISLDLYRTFAPLKQSTATLAFACLELASRLHTESETSSASSPTTHTRDILHGTDYDRWGITRAEVMETLLDLLELYTHYRTSTTIGPEFPLDTFLEVRIPLNEELNHNRLPRFTEYVDTGRTGADPAGYAGTVNGMPSSANGANSSHSNNNNSNNAGSGHNSSGGGSGSGAGGSGGSGGSGTANDKSPSSPNSTAAASAAKTNGIRQKAGERGKEGTVRFMLNPDRERQESLVVAEYQTPLPASPAGPASVPAPGNAGGGRPTGTPSGPSGGGGAGASGGGGGGSGGGGGGEWDNRPRR